MAEKKALLVIGMQNDFLGKQRKPSFLYDTLRLTKWINKAINEYKAIGYDIIYIAQVNSKSLSNRMLLGYAIEGTQGAKLYTGLNVVSNLYFEKTHPDAYTSSSFREHMESIMYEEVVLCGIDECTDIGETAKSAIQTGVKKVSILQNCVGCRFPEDKLKIARIEIQAAGVDYV